MVPYNRGATGLLNQGRRRDVASKGGKEASERHDPITNCTRHLNLDLSTRLEGPTRPFTRSFTHVFYSLVVAFFTCASGSTPQDEHQDTGRGRGRYRWNSVAFGSSRSVSWHHALSLDRPNRTAPCNPAAATAPPPSLPLSNSSPHPSTPLTLAPSAPAKIYYDIGSAIISDSRLSPHVPPAGVTRGRSTYCVGSFSASNCFKKSNTSVFVPHRCPRATGVSPP